MANIKSNIKQAKKSKKRNLINKEIKSEIKTVQKKAVSTKNAADINHLTKLIDQAVTHGTFHKNKAARLKSKAQRIK